jgi:hypothetical protein
VRTAPQPPPPTTFAAARPSVRPIVLALLVIAVAEVALRVSAPLFPSPTSRLWVQDTQPKYEQMRVLGRDRGGADTVFIGSSHVDMGIDPALLPTGTRQRRPDYNAAYIAGIVIPGLELWTNGVVLPLLQPRRVVIGVSAVQWASWGKVASRAVPALRRLTRAPQTAVEKADHRLESWFYLWRYRRVLRQPRNFAVWRYQDNPASEVDAGVWRVTPNGLVSPTRPISQHDEVWPARLPYNSDALPALERFVRDLQRKGIEVAIVDMPLSRVPVDTAAGQSAYQSHIRDMGALVAATKVPYLDAGVWEPAMFADRTYHLNPRGRRRLTRLISRAFYGDPSAA